MEEKEQTPKTEEEKVEKKMDKRSLVYGIVIGAAIVIGIAGAYKKLSEGVEVTEPTANGF